MCLAHFRERSTWFWKVAEYYRDDRPLRLDDPGSCFCSSQVRAYREGVFVLYQNGGQLGVADADFVTRQFTAELLGGTQVRKP
jgi:hypothetical protein